jgi:hypothetical protein
MYTATYKCCTGSLQHTWLAPVIQITLPLKTPGLCLPFLSNAQSASAWIALYNPIAAIAEPTATVPRIAPVHPKLLVRRQCGKAVQQQASDDWAASDTRCVILCAEHVQP